jgi:hypothetical protein
MGSKLTELSDQQFTDAAFKRVRSFFITITAAARIMEKQGSGVILGLTAPTHDYQNRTWEDSRSEERLSNLSADN